MGDEIVAPCQTCQTIELSGHFTEPAAVKLCPLCWKSFSGHKRPNLEIPKARIPYQAFSAKECQVILPEASSVKCEVCNMDVKQEPSS